MSTPPPRPRVRIDVLDVGPEDLYAQLPIDAEIYEFRVGSDGQDYLVAVASKQINFHASTDVVSTLDLANTPAELVRHNDDGSADIAIFGLVMAPRMQDTTFAPTMRNFPVALAYVIDPAFMKEDGVDFSKTHYAAVAFVSAL